jgi:hypothetical protein
MLGFWVGFLSMFGSYSAVCVADGRLLDSIRMVVDCFTSFVWLYFRLSSSCFGVLLSSFLIVFSFQMNAQRASEPESG